jgi:hypothetical protein
MNDDASGLLDRLNRLAERPVCTVGEFLAQYDDLMRDFPHAGDALRAMRTNVEHLDPALIMWASPAEPGKENPT